MAACSGSFRRWRGTELVVTGARACGLGLEGGAKAESSCLGWGLVTRRWPGAPASPHRGLPRCEAPQGSNCCLPFVLPWAVDGGGLGCCPWGLSIRACTQSPPSLHFFSRPLPSDIPPFSNTSSLAPTSLFTCFLQSVLPSPVQLCGVLDTGQPRDRRQGRRPGQTVLTDGCDVIKHK